MKYWKVLSRKRQEDNEQRNLFKKKDKRKHEKFEQKLKEEKEMKG